MKELGKFRIERIESVVFSHDVTILKGGNWGRISGRNRERGKPCKKNKIRKRIP